MAIFKHLVAGMAGLVVTGVGSWNTLEVAFQPGTPSQPGQKSQQPGPKNSQPRPSNSQPGPSNPQPDRQNPTPDPNNPGAPTPNDGSNSNSRNRDLDGDGRPDNDNTNNTTGNGERGRYGRPFTLSPGAEGHFNLATRRLAAMEAKMGRTQETLLRSLGEARRLSGPRQTEALFDVVQQMLQERTELQRYLVQSRTAWTGDLGDDMPLEDDMTEGEIAPADPAQTPAQPR